MADDTTDHDHTIDGDRTIRGDDHTIDGDRTTRGDDRATRWDDAVTTTDGGGDRA